MFLAPLLLSCAVYETRPAIDAPAYLFDLDVTIDPQVVAEYDLNVSKGSGSGMLRGSLEGAGVCIFGGAAADPSIIFGAAIGILISPICAVAGGVAGGVAAESKEDVAERAKALSETIERLNYPSHLIRLVTNDLIGSSSAFRFSELPSSIQQTSDALVSESDVAVNTTPALAAGSIEKYNSPQNFSFVVSNTEPLEKAEVEDGSKYHPTIPNAKISINITNFGLSGAGIDPIIDLQISATVCIREYASGKVIFFQPFTVATNTERRKSPMRLEEWAALDDIEVERVTLRLVNRLTVNVLTTMVKKRVGVDSNASCLS